MYIFITFGTHSEMVIMFGLCISWKYIRVIFGYSLIETDQDQRSRAAFCLQLNEKLLSGVRLGDTEAGDEKPAWHARARFDRRFIVFDFLSSKPASPDWDQNQSRLRH